ncbi:MAG: N-acetylmuramoyl-L-alanine amidase [Lachnospiraceae bacterium]
MQFTKDMNTHQHSPVALLLGIFLICFCGILLSACRQSENSESEPESGVVSSSDESESTLKFNKENPVVFLDAGHGGNEFGARSDDAYEKDINLQIVEKIKEILEKDGCQVFLTRDSDISVKLEDRITAAEKSGADVFVSVHQNSLDGDSTPHGIRTHCCSEAHAKSSDLASMVQNAVIKTTEAKDRGVEDNSTQYVLQSKQFPSCLIETGFLTSDTEGPLLQDNAYQDKIALGIANGIEQFLGADISARKDETAGAGESSSEPPASEASSEQEESSAPAESSTPAESSDESSSADDTSASGVKTTSGEPSPDEKVVYITIDDGPTTGTPKILDILDEYDAKATWFVTGQYMEGSALKDMLKQIHDRGNTIGVHTFSHQYKNIYSSPDAYMDDYNKMNTIIVSATGESSDIFRFPGGSNAGYNKKIRRELLDRVNSEGLVYYDWNAFTGDTEGMSCSEMISKAVKECSYNNKAILLMHDVPGRDTVVEALPEILRQLKEKGYEFRALDKEVTPIQFEK